MRRPRVRPPPWVLSLALWISLVAWPALGFEADGAAPPRTAPLPPAGTAADKPSPAWPDARRKVDPALLRLALAGSSEPLHFTIEMAVQPALDAAVGRAELVHRLQLFAETSQAEVRAQLKAGHASGHVVDYRPFWIWNGLSVTANAEELLALAARDDVRRIREDRWLQRIPSAPELEAEPAAQGSIAWNVSRIGADQAWTALGLDGTGVVVAIVDTGVDWQHPLIQSRYRGYSPRGPILHAGNWACTTDEGYLYPGDGNGHGTHVTGTAVGGRDGDGTALGVAPGARWIAVKALNNAGWAYDSWIHAAFEWIMAPAGKPELAPQVVNNSWGSQIGDNEIFQPDLQALRSAGIVPVFAAGNYGPGPATVTSPASLPEAVAVGASDDVDEVASFSGRGPSAWGEIKPEVVAPGTSVRSSLPGGGYGLRSGTSMAAPHVAGTIALVLQAAAGLSVDQIETLLTTTARPIGSPIPGNDAGWGRIDAYRAASVALGAGTIAGQVTWLADSTPIASARVAAMDRDGTVRGQTETGIDGHYQLALAVGAYDVAVNCFGCEPATAYGVAVSPGLTTPLSFRLARLPTGVLAGRVVAAEGGAPVEATISALGTPAATRSGSDGYFSLPLPAGSYRVEVRANGFRLLLFEAVQITAGQTSRLDAALQSAPRLLLVDSGPWYYGSQIFYFRQALDDRLFAYDTWAIRHLPADIPTPDDLGSYETVIWSAPEDAPGYIGAGEVISSYLTSGGSLLLTGQDVGLWDGGLTGVFFAPYYADRLKARALADDAGIGPLIGVAGEVLNGLTLPLNGSDSAQNQIWPDEIALVDAQSGAIIGRYAGDGDAALRVGTCLPYRAAYLAAGLEGLADRAARADTLERLISWLSAAPPPYGLDGWPAEQFQVRLDEADVRYAWTVRNTGAADDTLSLSLSPSAWPTSLWTGDFSAPLTPTLTLRSCQTVTVGVRVDVPPGVGWNESAVVTATAQSLMDPSQTTQAVFHTKTPAPILLVDDHRWYDVLDAYESALKANHLSYDLWINNQPAASGLGSPSLQRLQQYPEIIWFTGYDWYSTLTPGDETALATYLSGGGRLLFSSQDYLYTNGVTDFGRRQLGLVSYTEGLTTTQAIGAVGSPLGEGSGPLPLVYRYPNWSDALRPAPQTQVAFWGEHGQPVALTNHQAAWKTSFFAFPLETLPAPDLAAVLGRAVQWLSPLGDSTLAVDRPVAAQGDRLTYTLAVRNSGPTALASVAVSNTIPLSTTFVAGSLVGPASYDPVGRRVHWTGSLGPGHSLEIGYQVLLHVGLPIGSTVENRVHLSDETGLFAERTATTGVGAPDLSPSRKQVSSPVSAAGQSLAYTLLLHNRGLSTAQGHLVDPAPAYAALVPSSVRASSGVWTATADEVTWTGPIPPGQTVTITYDATIVPKASGRSILNRALLSDGWGKVHPLEAVSWVQIRLFLPVAARQR